MARFSDHNISTFNSPRHASVTSPNGPNTQTTDILPPPPSARIESSHSSPNGNSIQSLSTPTTLPGLSSPPISPATASTTYFPTSSGLFSRPHASISNTTHGSGPNSHRRRPSRYIPPLPVREAKAFRHMGYQAFSSFLASDDEALVDRKFSAVHVRTILMLQDEIVQLEEQLAIMDHDIEQTVVAKEDEYLVHNGSIRGDKQYHTSRYNLLHQLATLLEQYDRLVLNYCQIKNQPRASNRTLKSIKAWLKRYDQAITPQETGFLEEGKEDDLIATKARVKSPLRTMLENTRWFRRAKLVRLPPEKSNEYIRAYRDDDRAIFTDDEKIDIALNSVILGCGIFMLLVPAWGLNFVNSHTLRLAMITGFVAIFLTLLLLVGPFKPFETLVGTAAYGALLMVFMQVDK